MFHYLVYHRLPNPPNTHLNPYAQPFFSKSSPVVNTFSRVVKKWVRVNNGGRTTIMIRNIPNKLTRSDLVHLLDAHCSLHNGNNFTKPKSQYDFLYLPIDFKKRANKGYAFVNMTSSEGAARLCRAFTNFKWDAHNSNKICQLALAKIQGKDALKKRFEKTVFQCDREEYLPILFSPPRDGTPKTVSSGLLLGRYKTTLNHIRT